MGTAESDSTTTSSSAETSATAITKKEPISLEIDTKFPTIAPMSVAEKRTGRDRFVYPVLRSCGRPVLTDCFRLKAIDVEEASKRKREEARNTLEGYIYRLRDLLDDESAESPFVKCSQTFERKAISDKVAEAYSWLQEHGDDATTMEYIEKRTALEYVFTISPLFDLSYLIHARRQQEPRTPDRSPLQRD